MERAEMRREWREKCLTNLRRAYAERRELPSAAHDWDDSEERGTLDLGMLTRLFRAVVAEYS